MPKKKYKLQTPEYLKDSFIIDILGFDKSFLSRCKAGKQELSQERLYEVYELIEAISTNLLSYKMYLIGLLDEGTEENPEIIEKFSRLLSTSYEENHKKD